ncbi:MAG: PilW family protein [Deltaproteobacteria bacterium]|nr:PilW family protein [Deltaproteobacteria bacterium]
MQFAIKQQGFSLVELLVAMVVASIVGMAGYVIFSSSSWSYKVQEDVSEVQQNVRVATDMLAKDIRLAGFGLPDPPFSLTIGSQTFTSPITVTNSSTGPDTITVVGIGFEAGTLLIGAATDCNNSGTGKICLDSVESANNFFGSSPSYVYNTDKKYISLNGTTFIELSITQTERTSAKLTLETPSALDINYPDGTTVYIIQAITYTINTALTGCSATNPCLARQDLAGNNTVFASGIEDIQFAYGIDESPRDGKLDDTADGTAGYAATDFLNAPTDPSSIIAVKANIVGKTRNTDSRGGTFRRQCLEDRSADTTTCGTAQAPVTDGYRRRALTKMIKLRNPRQGA